jgi:hypothetical protein
VIPNAGRCYGGNRAPQDTRRETERALRRDQLQVHAGAWSKRALTFDERPARAQVDQQYRAARTQHGPPGARDRTAESAVAASFVQRLIHWRVPA